MQDRNTWRGEGGIPGGEAESLRPPGTWQQHLNLGQAGPEAYSLQPKALTPTDNCWARRWGLGGSGAGRQAGVTPCRRCLAPRLLPT